MSLTLDFFTLGTVVSAGDSWDTVRRFTIKHLNALGFGKKSAESCVMFDINNVMRSLETPAKEGKPIQLSNNFVITATSSLWKILVGKYIKDEEYFKNCLTTFHKWANNLTATSISCNKFKYSVYLQNFLATNRKYGVAINVGIEVFPHNDWLQ